MTIGFSWGDYHPNNKSGEFAANVWDAIEDVTSAAQYEALARSRLAASSNQERAETYGEALERIIRAISQSSGKSDQKE